MQDDTNGRWPHVAGTPPWGVRDQLNRNPAGLGARYRWAVVVDGIPSRADDAIRAALTAAARGYPVPMLIGDLVPRHYVLLVHHDPAGALFYEPGSGHIVLVGTRELQRRDFSALGFRHLKGAILPTGTGAA